MNLEKNRHSLAHIMAHAVKELYPEALFGMGPAIENGFYYDFDNVKISDEDFKKIEEKMRELIKQNIPFEKKTINKKEAENLFKDEPYKIELIKDIEGEEVTVYKSGEFTDLCSGPHVDNTKEISLDSFKLDRAAGAYFKGSEENKMLQRVYGLAFETKEELNDYLEKREEAERRDHRKIGKTLGLFMFDEEVGQGLPLYLPKGGMLRYLLINFAMETYLQNGYETVSTPHIAREDLWEKSGHLKFYKDDMYGPLSVDDKNYRLKPMNCPFHVKMYTSEIRSYRDLPIRWAEMGTVYRYEKSGELHGLTRPRGFTQDDAHIICAKDQLEQEIIGALEITRYIYRTLKMENLIFKLSVRDPKNLEKYFGENKSWEEAEDALKKALSIFSPSGYELDEGGAAFYAPKIDIDAVDAMGRRWQLSTIQVDFNLTSRFEMTYIDEEGKEQTPFMIHRALLGSIERFLGVYIEHTLGNFPLWLSPEQVWIIPVSEKSADYAKEVFDVLKKENFRVKLKNSSETLSKAVRNGEIQKIPYLLVVGEKEKTTNSVSIRYHGKDEGVSPLEDFLKRIREEIKIDKEIVKK
jgi:threonyl-tRNA synthetase